MQALASTLNYHRLASPVLLAHKRYAGKGRPGAHRALKAIEWQISTTFAADEQRLEALRQQKACFVMATNVPAGELSDAEVFLAYKNQSTVEHGFRFLKDPLFFVSSRCCWNA